MTLPISIFSESGPMAARPVTAPRPHPAPRDVAALPSPSATGPRCAELSFESLFQNAVLRWFKQTATRRVAAVAVEGPHGSRTAVLKWAGHPLTRLPGWLRPLAYRLAWLFDRHSLARSVRWAGVLERLDIPTPAVWAFHRLLQSDGSHEYLLTEAIPEALTLEDWLRESAESVANGPGPALEFGSQRCAILSELARIVGTLHAAGCEHRDLKFSNILVRPPAPSPTSLAAEPDVSAPRPSRTGDRICWLIDLEGMRQWGLAGLWSLPFARRVQNLARLVVSSLQSPGITRTDRLRFLMKYLGEPPARVWKTWWRMIARRAERKRAQNQRRGRALS